ncbi:MAG: galactokinase [Acutalibacteraceae bacterium]
MIRDIAAGRYDRALTALYGGEALDAARQRLLDLARQFEQLFGSSEGACVISAPGRTELGGNHTDHNGGRVLAASVSADMLAVARPAPDGDVRVCSSGRREIRLRLDRLAPQPGEKRTSTALVRGVAAYLREHGGAIGGFQAVTDARVPVGSGLSSSAAFEVLMGAIFNHLYNDGALSFETLALAGGYAENRYFEKPSGLMDQIACAAGGVVAVDFADPQKPIIRRIELDLERAGYRLCMVDVGGDHAGLTDAYAAIPREMKEVARTLGGERLCEVSREALLADLPAVRQRCGDRAVLRALHFFAENERVDAQAAALERGDLAAFLEGMIQSGHSSFEYLQNVALYEFPQSQPMAVALCLAQQWLDGVGGWRVHGGGFGGCIQTIVPADRTAAFTEKMEAVLGKGCCRVMNIRPQGSVRLEREATV